MRFHKKGADYDLCEAEFNKLKPEDQSLFVRMEKPVEDQKAAAHKAAWEKAAWEKAATESKESTEEKAWEKAWEKPVVEEKAWEKAWENPVAGEKAAAEEKAAADKA